MKQSKKRTLLRGNDFNKSGVGKWLLILTVGIVILSGDLIRAGGISVDAGLTPPQDRWIIRAQMRYVEMGNDPTDMNRSMRTYAFPLVLAYGIHSDFALMVRQAVMHVEMDSDMSSSEETGFGDLFVLGKYEIYRKNTRDYTFGLAPTLGFEFPTGEEPFTSDTWDIYAGCFASWRKGPSAMDFNAAYKWNSFIPHEDDINPGDEMTMDTAFAYQFGLGEKAKASLAPVLEFSYRSVLPNRIDGDDVPDTGGEYFYISPGIKLSTSSLIIEGLVQFPVWKKLKGDQLEPEKTILIGARIMF